MRSFRKLSGCFSTSGFVVLWALAFLIPFTAGAQENDDCLMCHEDSDLTGTRDGLEISVHVDPEVFSASIHADVECIMCHMDLEGTDFHDEEVEPVDCGMCHDSEAATTNRASTDGCRQGRTARTHLQCLPRHARHPVTKAKDTQLHSLSRDAGKNRNRKSPWPRRGSRGQTGAHLHHLSRRSQHPGGRGSQVTHGCRERTAALRPLPPGGITSLSRPRHCPGSNP